MGELSISGMLKKLKAQENVIVKWRDNNGLLSNSSSITITEASLDNNLLKSSLIFNELSPGDDKLYTCSMTLQHPLYNGTPSDSSQYRIIFGEKRRD